MGEQANTSTQPEALTIPGKEDVTTLATGATISFVGQVIGRGLFAISQILLARLLGPELFGLYALGWSLFRVLGTVAQIGLGRGVVRFATAYWPQNPTGFRSVLSKSLKLGIGSGALICGLLFITAPWIGVSFQKPGLSPVLRGFALAIPPLVSMKILVSGTQATQRMQFSVYAEHLGQTGSNVILLVLFWILGWGLLGSVAAVVASFGIAAVLALYFMRVLFPEAFAVRSAKSGISTRQLLSYSLPTALAGVFTVLTVWTNNLILGYFLPASTVGIFQAASQVSIIFVVTLRALNSIFAPMTAELYYKREMARLDELFKVSTKWGLYVSVPVYLTIVFAPAATMTLLFGHEYTVGAQALVILATGQIINIATGSVGMILIMTGRERQWMAISVLSFGLNFSLGLILVPQLGIVGAALATVIAISTLFIGGLVRVRQTFDLWPYDRRYAKGLAAAMVTAASLIIVGLVNTGSPAAQIIITSVIAFCVFGCTLLLLGIDSEDRQVIELVRSRFHIVRK